MKKNSRLLGVSFFVCLIILSSFISIEGITTKVTTTLQFSDDWIPGNALGNPGFVGHGNFTNKEHDEILLVSRIPEASDAMTLCYYNGENLTVEGSKDKDFSTVYFEMISDFDGDGDDEVFVSEDWTTEFEGHVGSLHQLYDFKDFSFVKNVSLYYYNPAIIIDMGLAVDLDENNDSELILATWDSENNTELVRVFDYISEDFVQLTNITFPILESDIYYRSVMHIGYGDFYGDTEQEILVFSKYTLDFAPGTFFYSFEMYSYDSDLQSITHEFSGRINTFESELTVLHTDIDQDGKDELITYYDRVSEPSYSVYDISLLEVTLVFDGIRSQSNYGSTGFYVIDILSQDVTLDGNNELIFVESKIDFGEEFKGRLEIYQYTGQNIESIGLESFLYSPTDVFISNINSDSSMEVVVVYNDYSDDFLSKGGIEIWSIVNDESELFPLFGSFIDYVLIFGGPLVFITIINLKRKKNRH